MTGPVMPGPVRTARKSVAMVQRFTGLPRRECAMLVRHVALSAASAGGGLSDDMIKWALHVASCAYDIAHPEPAADREDAGHGR